MRSFSYYTDTTSASNGPFVEVRKDQFLELVRAVVEHVEVDETWYRANYKDVNDAIESGAVVSATDHYVKAGYFEDRFPRAIVVDERWYLREYADVAVAIQHGDFISATHHFKQVGFKEGRLPRYKWSLVSKSSSRRLEFSDCRLD